LLAARQNDDPISRRLDIFYLCRLPGENRLGLKLHNFPILEFGKSRPEISNKTAFKEIFPDIDEATAARMVRRQFCAVNCTVRSDRKVTDEFCSTYSRRSVPMTLWARVDRFIWEWRLWIGIIIYLASAGIIALVIAYCQRQQKRRHCAAAYKLSRKGPTGGKLKLAVTSSTANGARPTLPHASGVVI
jgi:hypothetical protein